MGVSTNANIAYGWDLEEGEGLPDPWLENEEEGVEDAFVTAVAKLAGIEPPTEEWSEENSETLWRPYWKVKREAVEAYPIQLDTHCHHDAPMYIVYAKGTMITSRRGYPQVAKLILPPTSDSKLRAAAEALGIKLPANPPEFLLYSFWS